VPQRLLGSDAVQLLGRRIAEGAAGGGEDDAPDAVRLFAPEALPDGGVLAVDGAELGAVASGFGGDELAGDDEDLFVGQGESSDAGRGGKVW